MLEAIVGVSTDCDATPILVSPETQFARTEVALFEETKVPFSVQKIYPVVVEDTPHVFCILGMGFEGDPYVQRIMLSLLFIPTAYGEVEQ